MRYRNSRTGAVIETRSKVGGIWSPFEKPAAGTDQEAAAAQEEAKPAKKTTRRRAKKTEEAAEQ